MRQFLVDARLINDRPDKHGWYSRGRDVKPFYVDAASESDALAQAHDLVGSGRVDITRSVVHVFGDGDADQVCSSVRYWAGGAHVAPWLVTGELYADGANVSGLPGAEQYADHARWFTSDAECVVEATRSARGKWRLVSSDVVRLTGTDKKYRRDTLTEVWEIAQDRASVPIVEVPDHVSGTLEFGLTLDVPNA